MMSPLRPLARVDSRRSASVSFPAPEPPVRERVAARPDVRVQQAFGPGRVALAAPTRIAGGPSVGMTTIPVQLSKIQAPPLRDETLARERLLDWLSIKIHNRIVLVVAEAGYGKTTLLADFSRRTRVRMLWYRLDVSDRDPIVFLHHLVGAVRLRLPDACSAAASLLAEVGPTGPGLDAIVDALVRGLSELPADATALVLDDYHSVEDSPDIRPIMREILTRAPERLTLIIASRRAPLIPIARLRAQGEVAELRTADLRFDEPETERLFRETYAMPLDPGVASELARRTEGWAASLQLVQSAIRGRTASEVRSFVRSLTGAEGDLYDYLAEEVVGELPEDLQLFLMRTSVLDTVDPEFGAVAAGIRPDDVRSLIEDGERVGLLARRGTVGRHVVRAHPLVRDFLRARLRRGIGDDGIAAIHRRVAVAAEPLDWALAGRHYRAAGDGADVRRVLHGAIDSVLSSGSYATAAALLDPANDAEPDAATLVIRSREAMQRGDAAAAVGLAETAFRIAPSMDFAGLNALSMRFGSGLLTEAHELALALQETSSNHISRSIARSIARMLDSSLDGKLSDAIRSIEEVQRAAPDGEAGMHYRGVCKMNLAHYMKARGEARVALAYADDAIECLQATSAAIEMVSARLVRAWSLAHLGRLDEARGEAAIARSTASRVAEAAAESAELELLYGDAEAARVLLEEVRTSAGNADPEADLLLSCRVLLHLRENDTQEALVDARAMQFGQPATSVAMQARRLVLRAHAAVAAGESSKAQVDEAVELCERQGSDFWLSYARVLGGLGASASVLSKQIALVCNADPTYISVLADLVALRLDELDAVALQYAELQAPIYPNRWRPALRTAIRTRTSAALRAGRLLEAIGTIDDVSLLRTLGKSFRSAPGSDLGRTLARRVASRVWIEDLGRVIVYVGDARVEGSDLRRKVLTLLCLLLTRPRFAATREEVIETLWPALEPDIALNSLNQTVYFLRRVFEPDYKEELSPGYVQQDTEMVWLDTELIGARSNECRTLLRSLPPDPSPDQVWQLVATYRGRFALDFAYEDWAADHRGSLHVAYLRVVENAIRSDLDAGHTERGITVAERVLEIEPESDDLQAMTLRLYRLAGVHAAAAEQYSRYSHSLLDLGVQPPALEEL